jgi:hypothetical protein
MISRLPLALLLLALPLVASADTAKLLGKSGDWESFTYAEKGGKVCYMASKPKKSAGAPKNRSVAYITITHRTADKSFGVVNVMQSIAYRKDSPPVLEIGGTKFNLYVSGDSAWARDDKAIVAAFLKAKTATVHGTPAKGDAVVDTYSLDGFMSAYMDIGKACKI